MDKDSGPPRLGVNLLYIVPGLPGGTVTYARELLQSLAKNGNWRIMLYVQRGAFQLASEYPNVRYRQFGPFKSLLTRVLFEQLLLPLLAVRDGIQVLFSPGFVSPLFGLFRKVTTVHDLYYLKFPSFVRKWQRHYWSVMIPLSMRVSDRVIAVSESTARDLCEAFPWVRDKLDTIYHGRPQAAGAGRQGADTERYVLFVGNITPNKNIETVVGAMALLRERGSDLTLRLVGRDLFGRLRQCLSTMSKPPHVELRSEVNDAELTGLYRSAFCTVIASHYEGFGFPLMEAMAYGCPVISSGAGALREIGGEAALYFKPDSAAELASNILRLDAEPALRRKLVRLAEENITRFSWDKAALAHKETFLNCLPDGAPPSTRTNSDSGHDF